MWTAEVIREGVHQQESPDLWLWIGDALVMPDGKKWQLTKDGWHERT